MCSMFSQSREDGWESHGTSDGLGCFYRESPVSERSTPLEPRITEISSEQSLNPRVLHKTWIIYMLLLYIFL